MTFRSLRPRALIACAALGALTLSAAAHSQSAQPQSTQPQGTQSQGAAAPMLSPAAKFAEQGGEALYANVCQACHMKEGAGAVGAGAYPALANNANLKAAGYPVHLVVNGHRGMPPVGRMMSDEQVAEVVNYVRSHFGNAYTDAVTAKDVAAARP
ncbi:c-type cytochrome [Azospirillum thermophilum]|nr:cytochrome c [Azospirillum thermophilum]